MNFSGLLIVLMLLIGNQAVDQDYEHEHEEAKKT
jgi:hypothetical protein